MKEGKLIVGLKLWLEIFICVSRDNKLFMETVIVTSKDNKKDGRIRIDGLNETSSLHSEKEGRSRADDAGVYRISKDLWKVSESYTCTNIFPLNRKVKLTLHLCSNTNLSINM